jgi:hypothetical protein
MKDNESLWKKLHKAEVLDEFCALMFDQQLRYEELLEQLEQWGISSSMGALSRFSDSHRSQWTLERAKRQYESMLQDEGVDLDQAQRKVVAERLYNLAASPSISDKALLKMRDQEIARAKLELDQARLMQAETKLKQAQEVIDMQRRKIDAMEAEEAARKKAAEDAVNRAKDGGASEDTIRAVREALGMKVDD